MSDSTSHLDDLPSYIKTWRTLFGWKQLWGSQVTAFRCQCGDEVILSETDEPRTCDCGLEYRSHLVVQVRGPMEGAS